MGATSKYYLRIQESEVSDLPEYLRERITFVDDNVYKENEIFNAAQSKYIKAKRELEIVKYNIRHNVENR